MVKASVRLPNEWPPSYPKPAGVTAAAIRDKDDKGCVWGGKLHPGIECIVELRHVFERMVGNDDVELPAIVLFQMPECRSPEFGTPSVYLEAISGPTGDFVSLSGIAP